MIYTDMVQEVLHIIPDVAEYHVETHLPGYWGYPVKGAHNLVITDDGFRDYYNLPIDLYTKLLESSIKKNSY